jgi:hypothetical protein
VPGAVSSALARAFEPVVLVVLVVLGAGFLGPSGVAKSQPLPEAGSERGESLAAPPEGSSRPRRRPAPEATHAAADEAQVGPRVELGFSHYALVDGFGGGSVSSGSFGGFLPVGVLRAGAYAEVGSRSYELGQTELLVRGTLLAGYQHLGWGRFIPYAAAVGTLGVVLGKRFGTSLASALFGGGLEVGADIALAGSFYLGVSFAYIRAGFEGLGYDLWVFRLRAGL